MVSLLVSQQRMPLTMPSLFCSWFKWTATQWPFSFLSIKKRSFDMLGLHSGTASNNPMRRRFWFQPCLVQTALHQNGSTNGSSCRRRQRWTGLNIMKMKISPNFISVSRTVLQEQQQDSSVDSRSNVVHQLRYSIISDSAFNKQNKSTTSSPAILVQ